MANGGGQLVGWAPAHVLSDDGRVEWMEDEWGQVPTYQSVSEARRARGDRCTQTWQIVELRIAPEEGGS